MIQLEPTHLIENYPFVSSFIAIVIILGILIKVVESVLNFHENYVVKRYFKRLKLLSDNIDSDSDFNKYLNALKENEAFRLTSKVHTYPNKSNMLKNIYLTGIVANNELKRVAEFLVPADNLTEIKIGWFEKFRFAYSFGAMILMAALGILLGGVSIALGVKTQAISGIITMMFFLFFAVILGKDYKTLSILKRVKNRLDELNMVSNSDIELEYCENTSLMSTLKIIKTKISCALSKVYDLFTTIKKSS